MYNSLQQYNNSVSALAQGTNAEIQFRSAEFNQIMSATKAMLENTMRAFAAMVRNQQAK